MRVTKPSASRSAMAVTTDCLQHMARCARPSSEGNTRPYFSVRYSNAPKTLSAVRVTTPRCRPVSHASASGWQKVSYGIWRGDIVVDEQPRGPLLSKPMQRRLGGLLHVCFLCRCCPQRHGEAREGTQEPRARLGRTPANARIETSEAVRILNSQRGLTYTAHTLHCGATHRRLHHGSGLVLHQNGVEPVEFVSTTCEACDTRRHADKRSWRWLQCLRTSFRSGKDTAPPLLCVPNADEVLIDVGREQTEQGGILTAQDDHASLFRTLGGICLETGELHPSVRRLLVVAREQHNEV